MYLDIWEENKSVYFQIYYLYFGSMISITGIENWSKAFKNRPKSYLKKFKEVMFWPAKI